MEKNEKVVMSSTPTGTPNWKIRLHSILRYPMSRTGPAIVTAALTYVVVYNLGVRYWKGPDHPINRFMWRIQEQNHTLDPVLMAKKEKVLSYQYSRLFEAKNEPPKLGY